MTVRIAPSVDIHVLAGARVTFSDTWANTVSAFLFCDVTI